MNIASVSESLQALGYRLIYTEKTTSTMDDARRGLNAGTANRSIFCSRCQTSGRGRVSGRQWDGGQGQSLLFTAVVERRLIRSRYPLTQLAALALSYRLEKGYSLSPAIKWPNDVLIDGRKIAGILVESEKDYFLLGAGINIRQQCFPPNLRRPAVSLNMALDAQGGSRRPAEDILAELPPLIREFERVIESPPPAAEVERRLALRNRRVSLNIGDPVNGQVIEGRILGIQDDGALILQQANGKTGPVYSGEL